MKPLSSIRMVMAVAVCFVAALAGGHVQAQPTGTDEDTLKQLVRELTDAMLRGDVTKLEKLQHENFKLVTNKLTVDRRSLHGSIRNNRVKIESWTLEDLRVTVRGNTAVVTGHSKLTGATYMGMDYSGVYDWIGRFTKQRNGTWRAISLEQTRTSTRP